MAQKLKKKSKQVQKIVKKSKKSSKAAKASGKQKMQIPKGSYTEGVGRRKVATARVRIYKGSGDFLVNGLAVGKYFESIPNAPKLYQKAFLATDTKGDFAVTAKISGSGIRSQLDALVHGIARALLKFNPEFRPLLKEAGLLTRDDRMKESRKVGMGGKARRKRQSPKR